MMYQQPSSSGGMQLKKDSSTKRTLEILPLDSYVSFIAKSALYFVLL